MMLHSHKTTGKLRRRIGRSIWRKLRRTGIGGLLLRLLIVAHQCNALHSLSNPLFLVHVHVNIQGVFLQKTFATLLAVDWPLASMRIRMLFQYRRMGIRFGTQRTLVLSLARMQSFVILQTGNCFALDVALFALVDILCGRVDGVGDLAVAEEEFLRGKGN
jgi:hypothetical protein